MRPRSAGLIAIVGAALITSCFVSIDDVADDAPGDASAGSSGSAGSAGLGGSGGSGGSAWAGGSGGQAGDAAQGGGSGQGGGGAAGADAGSGGSGGTGATDGLLGHWKLDDGSGSTAIDSSPLARHGTLPTTGTTWTSAGALGGALEFGAPSGGVLVAAWSNAAFPSTGSISVWVKGKFEASETGSRGIFDNYAANRSHLFVRRANGNPDLEIQCAFQPAGQSYTWADNVPIQSGVWQLVVIAWSVTGNAGYCYAHGAKFSGGITTGWAPTDQLFEIGDDFNGLLDDVRLYDHMLTDAELATLLASGP